MANFELALEKTLKHEDSRNDPSVVILDDGAGKTYLGITEKTFPNWEGWETIEELKDTSVGLADSIQLRKDVHRLYYMEFWLPIHGDEIESQEIAEYLFDFAVNSGVPDAVKALQRANNRWFPDLPLKVDGIMGHDTITSLLVYTDSPHAFLDTFKVYRAIHYLKAIAANNKLAKFAGGWAERALA
jgi:lysozyme family protein